jgi:hypothetical protein
MGVLVLSLLFILSAGVLATVLVTQSRRPRPRFSLRRRRRSSSGGLPRLSEELLAGFAPHPPAAYGDQIGQVWRWSRGTQQFSITLYVPESAAPPATIGDGLLIWRLFTYRQEGAQVLRRESAHEQTVTEFLTYGPIWHAPTEILLEVLSYLGTDVPLWFEEIYLRECQAAEESGEAAEEAFFFMLPTSDPAPRE